MKKLVLAAAALTALAATPALARSDTHISFGFYAPAPVYYEPAPVVYYPPTPVYYAPPPCPRRYHGAYGHGVGHRWHRRHHHDDFAWNDDFDRGHGRRWH